MHDVHLLPVPDTVRSGSSRIGFGLGLVSSPKSGTLSGSVGSAAFFQISDSRDVDQASSFDDEGGAEGRPELAPSFQKN